MLRDDMAQEQVQMHSALETAAVVDIRTVLHQLGRQQMTAIRVMRVGLVLRAVQAVSAQMTVRVGDTHV